MLTETLRAANKTGREQILNALNNDPFASKEAIDAYTFLTDKIVILAMECAVKHFHPNANPTSAEKVTMLAVGGYGRAEMAPFSDVDLLFLRPYKQTAWGESVIETTLYILWDLSLKIGHAVRTVTDCIRQGKEDITVRTALLENRFLSGNQDLATEMDKRLWDELFSKTGPEFVEAKLEERVNRHKRQGGSRYLVEPNVKEGKGGLRDLQTLFWIAKYLNHANTPEDMVARGVFTKDELGKFRRSEEFLWTTRVQLHLYAGRPTEQMTFDAQVQIAQALGFEDSDGQRGVERFMQTYFTHARQVGELTRIFLVALEDEHVKKRPSLTDAILNAFTFSGPKVAQGYTLTSGRLDMADPKAFEKDPINILRVIDEGLKSGTLIHPNSMRRITNSLHLIDRDMLNDEVANRIFLDILLSKEDPIRGLRRMNELGVLGAFVPEFGRIVAMMQFNMYHHYTVDEHTIQCIQNLFDIECGKLVDDLPLATEILSKNFNRRVLYTALLLHDVGKGRKEDHSDAGAKVAKRLCPRLGLPEDEVDTVVWLVQNHLVMSDFAQKRDLSDERTVRDFANIVQSPARLKLLCVLTVCDIRGVGPGVWNNWKAVLLRQLYAATLDFLTGDNERRSRPDRVAEAKTAFADAVKGLTKPQIAAETDRHYDPFWLGLPLEAQLVFAKLIKNLPEDKPAISIQPDEGRDATRACFAMADHPGLFSRLSGALALAGANVVDGRTYTTSDGLVTAVFWIQDNEGAPYEAARLTRLRRSVSRSLSGEIVAREAFRAKDKLKKRERDFIVPTEINFDNEGSEIFTIVEVDTRDRPGLLYDLSRTLTGCGVSISSAIIATYGEQAVDSFYVKDLFGHKIHAQEKRDRIADMLKDGIQRGVERADA